MCLPYHSFPLFIVCFGLGKVTGLEEANAVASCCCLLARPCPGSWSCVGPRGFFIPSLAFHPRVCVASFGDSSLWYFDGQFLTAYSFCLGTPHEEGVPNRQVSLPWRCRRERIAGWLSQLGCPRFDPIALKPTGASSGLERRPAFVERHKRERRMDGALEPSPCGLVVSDRMVTRTGRLGRCRGIGCQTLQDNWTLQDRWGSGQGGLRETQTSAARVLKARCQAPKRTQEETNGGSMPLSARRYRWVKAVVGFLSALGS